MHEAVTADPDAFFVTNMGCLLVGLDKEGLKLDELYMFRIL